MVRGDPAPFGAHHYRVGELIAYLREVFARDPVLSDLWVSGEIVDLNRSAAGHWYFTLRDGDARIGVVLFRSAARRQALPLAAGREALVHGAVEIYDQRSVYQLVADVVLPGDAGRQQAEFEALRAKLETEGLFAPERKRKLPAWPRRIGVATSEVGAAIQDMLRVWERRFPLLEIVLAPTPVQGEEAVPGVVSALQRLNRYHEQRQPLDAIIVGRGGGSPEELAVFNQEAIARAIFASRVPVVSAIGHETDWTIADLVADLRAPTPSAAAEMVAPDVADLRRQLAHFADRLRLAARRRTADARSSLDQANARLVRRSPLSLIANARERVDELGARAARAASASLDRGRSQVETCRLRLTALSPLAILERGYAVCSRADDGVVVTNAAQVAPGQRVAVRVARGGLLSEVLEVTPDGARSAPGG